MNITNSLWSVYYIPLEEEFIMKGALIVFEGIDGSGTTTQLNRLLKFCSDHKIKAIGTQEPTSSPIGLLIRDFLNKCLNQAMQG